MKLILVVLFFALVFDAAFSQERSAAPPLERAFSANQTLTAVFSLSTSDTSYLLRHEFVIEGSESGFLDSTIALERGKDYVVDYRFGRVSFFPSRLRELLADTLNHKLYVSYRALPLGFRKQYSLRQVVVRKDSLGREEKRVESKPSGFSPSDLFGTELQKSGSIVRGFTLGSNRDLTLSSGFRMQLSGKLSRDIDIVAALTDENSPIQPEGTTQTLQEVDKVFVQISSGKYDATLGDFNLAVDAREGGEFGRLSRKLQGATGHVRFGESVARSSSGDLKITGATARGKFMTNQFQGVEGNQGPYRLKGRSGEVRLLVIAGTERVFINGELMTRGETNDYTVDYASGEILFTSKRLITNASRITVDFEYTDRDFTRNLVSAHAGASFLDDKVRLRFNAAQEADDPDLPLDTDLDEDARNRLKEGGTDRLKATRSGIRFVGKDSVTNVGRGQYALRDTSIGGTRHAILVYAPGDEDAVFAATFSFLEPMPRDSAGYIRVGAGQFRFAGVGRGNYLPVQFLPIPQLHRMMNVVAAADVTDALSISGEFALSDLDRNRLSVLDDQDRTGGAFKFAAKYSSKDLSIGSTSLGGVEVHLSERYIDRRFIALDRTNEIEFNRKWDLSSRSITDEEIREGSVQLRPGKSISFGAGFGRLERKGAFLSNRMNASVTLSDPSFAFIDYQFEKISSEDRLLGDETSWLRQKGRTEYTIWKMRPGLRVETEERTANNSTNDGFLAGSFRILELAPRLSTEEIAHMRASAEFQFRREDSTAAGVIEHTSSSLAQIYSWQLHDWGKFSSDLALNIKKTEFTEAFRNRGNKDSDIILVRSHSRYSPLQRAVDAQVFYEFSSQRSAQRERAFVRVPRGSGNYRYLGDVNGNGIADDTEFELTRFDGDFVAIVVPSDELIPVVDLKTSLRLRLYPKMILGSSASLWGSVVRSLSTESHVRVEERSTETDARQIYLLNLKRFRNDETTITGATQFAQDVHVFENNPDLSLRFRFQERMGFVRLINANERTYARDRSIRIKMQLVPEIGNQTELSNKVDRVSSTTVSLRDRDLLSNELSSDFSYRPDPRWEIGFKLQVSRVTDTFHERDAEADINQQSLRLTHAIPSSGQVRLEVRREEVVQSGRTPDPSRPLPFEFTGGRVVGQSYFWQLAFDYRIYQYMQVTVNYNGRSEGGRPAVHLARAEVRAFF